MVHDTYHSKRRLDKQNIYQLSYYKEVGMMCNLVSNVILAADSDCGDTSCDEDDSNEGNSGDHPCGAVTGLGSVPIAADSPATAAVAAAAAATVCAPAAAGGSGSLPIPIPLQAQRPAPPSSHPAPQGSLASTPPSGRTPGQLPLVPYAPAPPRGATALERARSAFASLLAKPGCVVHTDQMVTCNSKEISEVGYLLKMERRQWRLRNVQGLSPEKYVKYAASPLHFACASGDAECITLLLQEGCADAEAAFYMSPPLRCSEMLDESTKLRAVFEFWSDGKSPVWEPQSHHLFPAHVRAAVKHLLLVNRRRRVQGSKLWLCSELLEVVCQFVPTSILAHHLL